MTERSYRIILGAGLLLILYFNAVNERNDLYYAYISLLLFEGITDWRIPKIVTTLKYKILGNSTTMTQDIAENYSEQSVFSFEAERVLRLVMALLLLLPFIWSTELLWILPWFIACMLLLAGVTNICPMVMFFRRMGFK